jgi:hypothetical protein
VLHDGRVANASQPDASQPWEYDGRYYLISEFRDVTDRAGFGWELEDAGPTPRGIVLEAFWDETSGEFSFIAYTDHPLPFALVHRFVTEAAEQIPPRRRR